MWNLLKIFSWKKILNILNLISYFLHLSLHISFYHISIAEEGPLKKKTNCPNYNSTVDTFDWSNILNRNTNFTVKQSLKFTANHGEKVARSCKFSALSTENTRCIFNISSTSLLHSFFRITENINCTVSPEICWTAILLWLFINSFRWNVGPLLCFLSTLDKENNLLHCILN